MGDDKKEEEEEEVGGDKDNDDDNEEEEEEEGGRWTIPHFNSPPVTKSQSSRGVIIKTNLRNVHIITILRELNMSSQSQVTV